MNHYRLTTIAVNLGNAPSYENSDGLVYVLKTNDSPREIYCANIFFSEAQLLR